MLKIELPALLPNEHLLSALSRWFDTTGRNEFLAMTRRISSNLGMLSPSSIWRPVYGDLANHYMDTVGLSRILSEHTLTPFYKPFLKEQERLFLSEEHLNTRYDFRVIPVAQIHVKAAHHWRWCAECADDDYEQFGVTYWHVYHQIPTALRCLKHKASLLSKCQSCSFEYKNFLRHWKPPTDRMCLECASLIEVKDVLNTPVSHWLDAISLSLQHNQYVTKREEIIELMKVKMGFETLPINKPVALRKKFSANQKKFEKWLVDEGILSSYIVNGTPILFTPNQKLFNIIPTVYRDSIVPPISVLLMLKWLGLDHELAELLSE